MSKATNHYLYFIKCNEFIKIGHTSNIRKRILALQGANPYKLELFAVAFYDSKIKAVKDERRLHTTYKNKRTSGEWFENLNIEEEWSKINALTYSAYKYEKHISLKQDGDIENGALFDDVSDQMCVEIPKQYVPASDERASRNSTRIIYHLLCIHSHLRSGRRRAVNRYLDFPVSDKTISKARESFKKYINKQIDDSVLQTMFYIEKRPELSYDDIQKRLGVPMRTIRKAKHYLVVHTITKRNGIIIYD